MTKEQMDKMTKKEMRDYLQKCKVFDPDMSFEEYQEAVRDAIYIDSGLLCGKSIARGTMSTTLSLDNARQSRRFMMIERTLMPPRVMLNLLADKIRD